MKSRAAVKPKSIDSDRKHPMPSALSSAESIPDAAKTDSAKQPELQEVLVDGRRITFTAETEIVLRCGKSSITLTRAGKIIISGEYVVSRSSGVNRIRGGSVQIN